MGVVESIREALNETPSLTLPARGRDAAASALYGHVAEALVDRSRDVVGCGVHDLATGARHQGPDIRLGNAVHLRDRKHVVPRHRNRSQPELAEELSGSRLAAVDADGDALALGVAFGVADGVGVGVGVAEEEE